MSNTTYICVGVIVIFIALSYSVNEDSHFEIEDIPELSKFNQELDKPLSIIDFDSYSDPEIEEMENLLEKDFSDLKEEINIQAWSILVDSYSSKEDVMKDFVLLNKKGYKAYIRDSTIAGKVVYTLNVGPNINEETVRSKKKEIQDILGVSPTVQYFQD
jgi:hypothetical protein